MIYLSWYRNNYWSLSMKNDRSGAEKYILKFINKLSPNSDSGDNYKRLFSYMNNVAFGTFMKELEEGSSHLSIVEPNLKDNGSSVENNLKIADELGHDFFEKLWITDGDMKYLTPVKYMVIDLPLKRASQSLVKKISVPDHNKVIDSFTGQPTGASKGAKISYPELQLCAAMGLDDSMVELVKYRGGDKGGFRAYTNNLSKTGKVSLSAIKHSATGVESTKTLHTFLTSAMLKNNL